LAADIQSKPPEKRKRGNPNWVKGAGSPNPGGKPKKLVEIEAMLDAEHRTVANMKEVFAQLRAMATENVITRWTDKEGKEHESIRQPNPAFMALYLDRVLGPVKELKIDLTDAPEEVLTYLAEKLN
jgi:hypothetical protein